MKRVLGLAVGFVIAISTGAAAATHRAFVYINCQHNGKGLTYTSFYTARQHPANCNIWGLPPDLADLFELRTALAGPGVDTPRRP